MIKAITSKQIVINASDRVGTLATINDIVSQSGINMIAICAYKRSRKSEIMFVSENNAYAKRLLKSKGFEVTDQEIVLLTVENRPGSLRHATDKIAEAGIDMTLIYGSVEKVGKTTHLVLVTEDNKKALAALRRK